jgi:hypothetical protein
VTSKYLLGGLENKQENRKGQLVQFGYGVVFTEYKDS